MAIITDLVDIIGAEANLRIGQTNSIGVLLSKQIRNHRLHAGAGK